MRLPRRPSLTPRREPRSPRIAFAAYWIPSGGGGYSRPGMARGELGTPRSRNAALRALAISPSAAGTVYAGPAGVWRSDDSGEYLERCGRTHQAREEVESRWRWTPVSRSASTRAPGRQAYRSLDGGGIWAPIALGMDLDRDVFTIAV